jgi:hypothetical protein
MNNLIGAIAAIAVAALQTDTAGSSGSSASKGLSLMAESKDAIGGANLDRCRMFHETGSFVRDGKTVEYETFGDLNALRTAGMQTVNGKTSRAGFDDRESWRVSVDGRVTVVSSAQALKGARLGAYLTVGAFLYPDRFPASIEFLEQRQLTDRLYDVVAVSPKDADRAELWLDAKTHRLARIVASTASETAVAELSDYRLSGGIWIAFAGKIVDNGHIVLRTVSSYACEPLDESRLSAPRK